MAYSETVTIWESKEIAWLLRIGVTKIITVTTTTTIILASHSNNQLGQAIDAETTVNVRLLLLFQPIWWWCDILIWFTA